MLKASLIKKKKINSLINNLLNKKNNNISLKVGFFQQEIAKIAIINEFGAQIPVTDKIRKLFAVHGFFLKASTQFVTIPPRPFMQQTINNHSENWQVIFKKLIIKYNGNIEQALNALGMIVMDNIKKTIEDGNFIPNHPLTVILKNGKNTPLIHTGEMEKSINFEVK